MQKYDLHIHSLYSDGDFDSKAIGKWVRNEGVSIYSITDHDTLHYYDLNDINLGKGYILIPGIEISACGPSGKTVHLLGYGIDVGNTDLRQYCNDVKKMWQRSFFRCYKVLKSMGIIKFPEELQGKMSYNRLYDYVKREKARVKYCSQKGFL